MRSSPGLRVYRGRNFCNSRLNAVTMNKLKITLNRRDEVVEYMLALMASFWMSQ